MRNILLLVVLFFSSSVYSDTLKDTVELKEVTTSVQVIRTPPPPTLFKRESNTIDKALLGLQSMYIKNYGGKGLASIAYRGTSAAQNEIYWNGIKINSPLTGQVDCSLLPIDPMQMVVLSANGNTIGAKLDIDDYVMLGAKNEIKYQLLTRYLSLGAVDVSNSIQTQYKNFYSISNLYFQEGKYDYKVPAANAGNKLVKQTNAQVRQLSFRTTLGYNYKGTQDVVFSVWWMNTHRQLPPVLGKLLSQESQYDESLRLVFRYKYSFVPAQITIGGVNNLSDIELQTAFLKDDLLYSNPEMNLLSTNQSIASRTAITYSKGVLHQALLLKLRLKYDLELGRSMNLLVARKRQFYEVNEMINYRHPNKSIFMDAVFFQTIYQKKVYCSANVTARFYSNKNWDNLFAIQIVFARTLRFPSLNDLYWAGAGNQQLSPEKGWRGELRVEKQVTKYLNLMLTGYGQYIENWILWHPLTAAYWKPENLKKVYGYGIESEAKIGKMNTITGAWFSYAHARYSWNKMLNAEPIVVNDLSKGKQLIYVPLHRFNLSVIGGVKGFVASFDVSHNGIVYTATDNTAHLPAYTLFDLHLRQTFLVKEQAITVGLSAYNLANTYYQTMPNRAMPGRYFECSLKFNLKG